MVTAEQMATIQVSEVISHVWLTCYRRPSGCLRRLVSPRLPSRETREEAEADLQQWLEDVVYKRGSLRERNDAVDALRRLGWWRQ